MLIAATRYADCDAALRFLTGVLGLREHAVYRDEDGQVIHAELALGQGMLMFGPATREGDFAALMTTPAATGGRVTASFYGVVPDVAARYARAVAAGADIVIPLRDEDYGGQSFTLRDPEGQIWTLGSYDPFAPETGTGAARA